MPDYKQEVQQMAERQKQLRIERQNQLNHSRRLEAQLAHNLGMPLARLTAKLAQLTTPTQQELTKAHLQVKKIVSGTDSAGRTPRPPRNRVMI